MGVGLAPEDGAGDEGAKVEGTEVEGTEEEVGAGDEEDEEGTAALGIAALNGTPGISRQTDR